MSQLKNERDSVEKEQVKKKIRLETDDEKLASQESGFIRLSTDADMEEITRWVTEQDKEGITTFHANLSLIKQWHSSKDLTVYIDGNTQKAIGYVCRENFHPQILEVRADKRGQGIGKKLAQFCFQDALKNQCSFLKIECQPETSIPFWQNMGFRLYASDESQVVGGSFASDNHAYKYLELAHTLPKGQGNAFVEINFYPEEKKYREGIKPIRSFKCNAVFSDGLLHLQNRIACDISPAGGYKDIVVEVLINGKSAYCDKAKHPEAKGFGCQQNGYIYCFDKITNVGHLIQKNKDVSEQKAVGLKATGSSPSKSGFFQAAPKGEQGVKHSNAEKTSQQSEQAARAVELPQQGGIVDSTQISGGPT